MQVAKVVGNLWATRKDENLSGTKLLLVVSFNIRSGQEGELPFVAVDSVGAGVGDTVLVVGGSSARGAVKKSGAPVDATIVGIVDEYESE